MQRLTLHIGLTFCMLSSAVSLLAQTPGLIYQAATGAGAAVLDPNSDGYTSSTTAGYLADDQTESEIPFTAIILAGPEPDSDLDNAPDCGYTDFVDDGDRHAAQKYLSGAGNWIFRFRLGGSSPNAKSYSVLIDTDGLFGNSGATADPDYTIYNPGFEIEIVLATKFGVYVYDVNTPNCTPVISYAGTTHYQKSIALSDACSDPDYFLDFFVAFADLTAQFGITQSTPMRYAIVDNTSSNSSTMCSPSSASDVAGAGSFTNLGLVLTDAYDAQGPCAPDGTGCKRTSDCPPITNSLVAGGTSISGTSTEADGTTINIYKNGTLLTSTTVTAGAWSVTGLTAFAADDVYTATATATGESESHAKCNTVTVSSATCTAMVSSVNVCNSNKSFQGVATVNATVKMYDISDVLQSPTGGTTWNAGTSTITATSLPSALTPTTDNFLWKCNSSGASTSCGAGGGPCITDGNYYVTAQSAGECESPALWFCVGLAGTTATPTITTTITTATTSVSGTVPAPDNAVAVNVYLYRNNILVGSVSTSTGSWTMTGLTFGPCDIVKAQAIRTAATKKCPSPFSTSQSVVFGPTDPPVILGSFCTTTTISTVSGISTEADGTVIQVYDDGVPVGSTTTVSDGVWTVTGLSISPGHTLTATALATCETLSDPSDGFLVTTQSSSATLVITTSPIEEEASTISGTYATDGSTVQLYLDGSPIGSPATVAGGAWSVTGLATYDLTTGGELTASVTIAGGCSSTEISAGNVQCVPPNTGLTVTPASATLVTGNPIDNVQITNSELSVIYQIYLEDETTKSGPSVRGTGGTITMTSGPLSESTTLKIKAIKVSAGSCSAFLGNVVIVVVVLPIELTSFTVTKETFHNELAWTTASELNNDFFTVEKTLDGNNFEIISIQKGAGSSIEPRNYKVTDFDVKNVINYYRLKQTDFDGMYKYSSMLSVDNRENEKEVSSTTNVLGEEVNEYYRGIVFIRYSDGTLLKIIQ